MGVVVLLTSRPTTIGQKKTLPTGPKNNWCQENNLPACHRPQKLWGNSVQGLDTQTKKSQNFILSTLGKIISWKIQSPHSGNQLWKIQSIQTQGILSRNIQTHWKCFLEIFNPSTPRIFWKNSISLQPRKKNRNFLSLHTRIWLEKEINVHTPEPRRRREKKFCTQQQFLTFSTLPTNFVRPPAALRKTKMLEIA